MVSKTNAMWRLAAVLISLGVGVACGKGKTPTSPSGASTATPAATQVGIAVQGIAIDGQYTMNVGDRLQVSAMVTMSDGSREDRTSTATWTAENPAIATAVGGMLTAVAAGQTVVTARYDQVLARLTVTVRGSGGDGGGGGTPNPGPGGSRTLTRIEVEGATSVSIGAGTPLVLVGHYSDGSRERLSQGITWTVEPATHAALRDGQLWGMQAGTVVVTATHDGHVDTHTATVGATAPSVSGVRLAGNTSLSVGGTSQLVAMARLSDGSEQSATTLAQWQSNNPAVATVADGLVRGVSAGTAVITASVAGVAGQATVTVSSAGPGAVTSLTLSGTLSVGPGATTQLTAMARFADGSQQDVTANAQWTSSNGALVSVTGGLVTGIAAGTATITAQYQGASAQATLQVTGGGGGGGGTPTVVSLAVTGTLSVATGQTVQLTATATLSNGSTQNVTAGATWSSGAPAILSVNGGLVSGLAVGAGAVSAAYQGQTATVQVSVSAGGGGGTPPPTVVGISVTGNVSIGIGVSSQLTVRATMSNGTIVDVTGQATYQSSNPLLVSVSATGQLTGLLAGLANVTATYQGVSASVQVTITVSLPVVNALTINGPSSVKLLQLLTLSAVATMSDGSQQTVTEGCQWSSSNLGVLDFVTNGVLRALLVGNVTVTANYQGKSATKTITVTLL